MNIPHVYLPPKLLYFIQKVKTVLEFFVLALYIYVLELAGREKSIDSHGKKYKIF